MEKTNVMRILEQKKITYHAYTYGDGTAVSGDVVAEYLQQPMERVFKTLVAQGSSKVYYVFMIPVNCELNLKKGAAAVGEKSIAMIKSKELLPLTGYVHGGCSPIGMKKQFRTLIHHTAADQKSIFFSAGRIGFQVEMPLSSLEKVISIQKADLTTE